MYRILFILLNILYEDLDWIILSVHQVKVNREAFLVPPDI